MQISNLLALPLASGVLASIAAAQTGDLLHQWNGPSSLDQFGFAVDHVGDINGDGHSDLIVGAPEIKPFSRGRTYLYSGRDGSQIRVHRGGGINHNFGNAVSGIGDVDGDGVGDYVVGATQTIPGGAGYIRVYSGRTGTELYQLDGSSGSSAFGFIIDGVGDINQDGAADFIVGEFLADRNATDGGSATVFSGADGSKLYRKNGGTTENWTGISVAGGGDIDGDGVPDFVVGSLGGASGTANNGTVKSYSGATGSLIHEWLSPQAGSNYGCFAADAGDVDADGFADVIVGAEFGNAAFVYSGQTGALILQVDGPIPASKFGNEVSGIGDVNGDGFDDVLVGAPDAQIGHKVEAGAAYLISGQSGDFLFTWEGEAGDQMGNAVSDAGDVNADGSVDVILGANFAIGDKGAAYVYSLNRGLTLEVSTLIAGRPADISVSSAEPNADVLIGYSLTGPGPTSTPVGDVSLSLPIEQLPNLRSDASGAASITVNIPPQVAGASVWLQAYCAGVLSNGLAETIL